MPHHKVHAPSPGHYDCERLLFGDRWLFGIECELQKCELDPWGSPEPLGSFWFWAGGQIVGNTAVAEQLMHAFAPLNPVRNASGNRRASDVPGVSLLDKLDFIIWLRCGDDSDYDAGRWGNRDIEQLHQLDPSSFEVIQGAYSPFQDGWEAVLLEDGEFDILVWRQWSGEIGETYELSLLAGECVRVIAKAADWFWSFRGSRVESEDRESDERPVLVERSDDPRFAGI